MDNIITQRKIDHVLTTCIDKLDNKFKKHGYGSFHSICEIYGKLQEENYEVLKELHKKDIEKFKEELYDVAIVALYGIISLEE